MNEPLLDPPGLQQAHPAVRLATLENVPALCRMLRRAYAGDPFFDWLVRPGPSHGDCLDLWFDAALRRILLPHGATYTTSDCAGLCGFVPPGRWKMSVRDQLGLIPALARAVGPLRIPHVMRGIAAVEARHPAAPHWYGLLLAVDPAAQGLGLGLALAAPILARCDAERIPAYIETPVARNVRPYLRHGFRVTGEMDIPGGPHLWLLWREPGAGRPR